MSHIQNTIFAPKKPLFSTFGVKKFFNFSLKNSNMFYKFAAVWYLGGAREAPFTFTYVLTDGCKTLHTLLIKYYIDCLDGQSRGRGRGRPAYL